MNNEEVHAGCMPCGLAGGASRGGDVAWNIVVMHEVRDLFGGSIKVTSDDKGFPALAKESGDSLEKLLGLFGVVHIAINGKENGMAQQ